MEDISCLPYRVSLTPYCVEVNPEAARHAETLGSLKGHVHARLPKNLNVDVIYSTSILQHVDCPLCELGKLRQALNPAGVELKSVGFDPRTSNISELGR